jgi:hypothetical protein
MPDIIKLNMLCIDIFLKIKDCEEWDGGVGFTLLENLLQLLINGSLKKTKNYQFQ